MEEIQILEEGADVLGRVHGEVAKWIRSGTKTKQLDVVAEEFIKDHGGVPSFKNYNGFPASLCISVNDTVVHGIPNDYQLQDTDVVSIDCGVFYRGYHTDSAYTYPLQSASAQSLDLLNTTYESLYIGIAEAEQGNRLGDIGYVIQHHAENAGYSIVRDLVGHGIGKNLHESPEVPNYGKKGKGTELVSGMVFAIEPMVNMGKRNVEQAKDGWTIRTKDRLPSAHFEHTIAIFEEKTRIITTYKYIEENYTYKWRSKNQ